MKIFQKNFKIPFVILILSLILNPGILIADTTSKLQSKIDEKNEQIKSIEREINRYKNELQSINQEAKTLQNAINSIDATINKVTAEITSTKNRIDLTNLNIDKLEIEIAESKKKIDSSLDSIASILKMINDSDESPMILALLSNQNISDIWNDTESLKSLQLGLQDSLEELRITKSNLETQRAEDEQRKKELLEFRTELSAQRQISEQNKSERSELLRITKNTESEYKALLAEQERRKQEFERELFEFESQLKITLDPSQIPSPRPGLLSWPLDNIYITQNFGRTIDSQRLYVSGTHNGVDFRASVGTRVRSVADGVVEGVGNTDSFAGCYSYGKWVLIRHSNGLSSLYAHLSVISVNAGQAINRGDIVGFSGNTGYSTGPHLHLTVYATQGVKISKYESSIGCKQATIPLADSKAYLDPMLYLPPLNI